MEIRKLNYREKKVDARDFIHPLLFPGEDVILPADIFEEVELGPIELETRGSGIGGDGKFSRS